MSVVDACIIAATIVAVALCGLAAGVVITAFVWFRRQEKPLDGLDSDSDSDPDKDA